MIEANTYLLVNRKYQPIAAVSEPVPDPFYIEGVIELSIDGRAIITRAEWDLVDQLWAYLVDGACQVASGGSFFTRFPDQPIELRFSADPDADTVLVELRYPGLNRPASARVPRSELIDAIARAAEPVFRKLIELAPANRAGYESVLRQIDSLKRAEA